jgi:Zn-dependent M28 family amino/carboxypeptidase
VAPRTRLEQTVRTLASSPRHGSTSPAAHTAAADYIERQLRDAGCFITRQRFSMPDHPGRMVVNIIGELHGQSPRAPAVLIGAHYDTRPNSPGADDNASGVAVLLECALSLATRHLEKPVIFAAFDAEERQDPDDGLRGSTAYVESLALSAETSADAESHGRKLTAAFILEMVGFSSPSGAQRVPLGFRLLFPRQALSVARRKYAGDFLIALSRGRGNRFSRLLAQCAASGGTRILRLALPGWFPPPADLLRSDHAPFWRAGIPTVMVGDTANFRNPHYHLPSDTPDTLDYDMIAAVSDALATTVAAIAAHA